jgi:hypothetical protein
MSFRIHKVFLIIENRGFFENRTTNLKPLVVAGMPAKMLEFYLPGLFDVAESEAIKPE